VDDNYTENLEGKGLLSRRQWHHLNALFCNEMIEEARLPEEYLVPLNGSMKGVDLVYDPSATLPTLRPDIETLVVPQRSTKTGLGIDIRRRVTMAKEKTLKKASVADLRKVIKKLEDENAELRILAADSESY